METRLFFQEDSPWVEMNLSWDMLTEGQSSRTFKKGYIFYSQQEYCDNVFVIKRGRVAMCLCAPEGGMHTAVTFDENCMFGNQTLYDGKPNSCLAQVVSDTAEIYVLPKPLVLEKMKSHPELVYNMLQQSNRVSRTLLTQLELMSFESSEGRVCFFLLHMLHQYSVEQGKQWHLEKMHFTHQDIADVTGLSRVCVSNIISGLVKEGILAKSQGTYRILEPELLRRRTKYYNEK